MRKTISCLSALILALAGMAQDYNPNNPPEPSQKYKHWVTVTATPAEIGQVSGAGRYEKGARVDLRASSATSDYAFAYWEKNGERFSTSSSLRYTMEDADVAFNAVFEYKVYNPDSPKEPNTPSFVYKRKLYLACEPPEACSFSRDSGRDAMIGEVVTLTAYPNYYYVFQGWYDGDTKVSDSLTISYTMGDEDARLVARFEYVYDPANPAEPNGSQSEVDQGEIGDANNDGRIDLQDAEAASRMYLDGGRAPINVDINGDGRIDATDIAAIINMINRTN